MANKRIWVNGERTNIEIRDEAPSYSGPSAEIPGLLWIILIGLYVWFDWRHNWVIATVILIVGQIMWLTMKFMFHLATFGYFM